MTVSKEDGAHKVGREFCEEACGVQGAHASRIGRSGNPYVDCLVVNRVDTWMCALSIKMSCLKADLTCRLRAHVL